jgi:SPP1 family predicted phage head-tail adaptor
VNPGKYRHRVEIQEKVEAQNPVTGVITATWQTVSLDSDTPMDSVPAQVMTGQGREMHAAGTKLAETDARINFRWFPGLDEAMRVIWDGKTYGILSISTDLTGRREYRLHCKGLTDGS